MAKPQIFVSSTFYDLKHIRASLESFIERLGYDPILSEKGKIAYDPDVSLDESCYRGASDSDMFVLIVGGRYGAASSGEDVGSRPDFYDRYESITKLEYNTACNADVPTYILVEKAVYSEYETYKKNRSNDSIEYAHVDSVNVFHLIDQILNRRRNNPLHLFEQQSDIEHWLREQWAGLFRELIKRRSEQRQLYSLSEKVEELSEINGSLQRYLEAIVTNVIPSPGEADEIIQAEQAKVSDLRRRREFEKEEIVLDLLSLSDGKIDLDRAIRIFSEAESVVGLARYLEPLIGDRPGELVAYWEGREDVMLKKVNAARDILNLPAIPYD